MRFFDLSAYQFMTSEYFSRISGPFSEFGILSGLLYLLNKILSRLGGRCQIFDYDLMVQPVPAKAFARANQTKSFEVKEIRDARILEGAPPPLHVIEDRFLQSATCLGAYKKNALVGYQWLCLGPYEEDEVRCTFVPQPTEITAFDFDIYIFPEYRLGLGFVALWDAANKYLRDRKIQFTTSRVSRFNTASRRSHQHFGWRRAGRAVFFCGKTWQLMIATVAPYCHVSFSPASRPRLVIRAQRG